MQLVIKRKYGIRWILIFFHDSSTGKFYNDTTAYHYVNPDDPYMYSIIGDMRYKHRYRGSYEYLIEYPALSGYNQWIQTIDIGSTSSDQTASDIGYKDLHIDFPHRDFYGISKSLSTKYTVFDGSPHLGNTNDNYWFSIGAKEGYSNETDFPGPQYAGNYDGVQKCLLWLRANTITIRQIISLKIISRCAFAFYLCK